jgi:hypothetical protein
MRRFATAQRVFVIVDHAGNRIDRAGTVRRLRRSDDGAWVELDERHECCPFPADDASRDKWIQAYPEDCRPLSRGEES